MATHVVQAEVTALLAVGQLSLHRGHLVLLHELSQPSPRLVDAVEVVMNEGVVSNLNQQQQCEDEDSLEVAKMIQRPAKKIMLVTIKISFQA